MPEKYTPTPDDIRPTHPELETSIDEFLNDLNDRIDTPYTPAELRQQTSAHEERRQQAQDDAEIEELIASSNEHPDDRRAHQEQIASAVQEQERMEALSPETQQRYRLVRTINEQVRHEALKKQGSAELGRLANAIIETWRTLEESHREYIASGEVAVFEDAIQESLKEFHRIEHDLERLQNKP